MTAPTITTGTGVYVPHLSFGDTFTFSLPAGYETGDRIVAVFVCDWNGATVRNIPDGWTQIGTGVTSSTNVAMTAAYKDLVGGEGATAAFTTNALEAGGAISWRIHKDTFDPAIAPQIAFDSSTSGASPDPPNITPTGGPKDFAYLAAGGLDKGNSAAITITGFPAGYSNTGTVTDTGATSDVALAWGSKTTTGSSSEDPAAFVPSAIEQWVACTIAIHPLSVTAPTKKAATVDDASATAYTLGAEYTQTSTEYAEAMPVGTADHEAAAIVAGTGATGTASNAQTANTPDTYTLTPSHSTKHPIYDIHRIARNAGGDSAISRHYDDPLDPPAG
jgi:hypothetical protein